MHLFLLLMLNALEESEFAGGSEPGVPSDALLAEDNDPLLEDESGDYLLEEAM